MLANVGKPATAVTFVGNHGNLGLPASNTPQQLGKDGLASDGWHRGANGSRGSTELLTRSAVQPGLQEMDSDGTKNGQNKNAKDSVLLPGGFLHKPPQTIN